MTDPASFALDALFHAPGSEPAIYIPVSGEPFPVRIVRRQNWAEIGSVRPRPSASGEVLDIRRSEVTSPAVGDAIAVSDHLYAIIAAPETDNEGLTWICDVPKLDRRITVLQAVRGPNEYGDLADGFGEIAEVVAARVDRVGTEVDAGDEAGNQVVSRRSSTFFVAWSELLAAVTNCDRVIDAGVAYDVTSVVEVGLRAGIEITGTAHLD